MELRLIKLSYQGRGGRKATLILVTTLLDHIKYDGIELADLYARRWDIELKLRDLKTTMNMEFFAVKSPEMAHKTLLMSMIAHNLIRRHDATCSARSGKADMATELQRDPRSDGHQSRKLPVLRR